MALPKIAIILAVVLALLLSIACRHRAQICYPESLTGEAAQTAQYAVAVAQSEQRIHDAQRAVEETGQLWFLCKGSVHVNCAREMDAWRDAQKAYEALLRPPIVE